MLQNSVCGSSVHWKEILHGQFECIPNISSYWKTSRPWNNLASISLFPHIRLRSVIYKTNFVDHAESFKSTYNIFPAMVLPIRIFAVHPSESQDTDHLTKLIVYLVSPNKELRYYSFSYQLLYFNNSSLILSKGTGVEHDFVVIQDASIVQLCRNNFTGYLNLALTNQISVAIIMTFHWCHNATNQNNLLFDFLSAEDNHDSIVVSALHKKFKICENDETRKDESLQVDRLAEGYASVWISVMCNFPYVDEIKYWQICDNGKIGHMVKRTFQGDFYVQLEILSTFTQVKGSSTLYPAIVTSLNDDLRMVTCGYKGVGQLPFMEFLIAFDNSVWLGLIIILLTCGQIFHQISSTIPQLSRTEGVLMQLKLLLEQRDPFPTSIIHNHRYKAIAGAVLLMGIILGNANKNTNVHNMIMPRIPVPFQYLQELVSENFNIYTRTRYTFGLNSLKGWLFTNDSQSWNSIFGILDDSNPHARKYNLLINLDPISRVRMGQA